MATTPLRASVPWYAKKAYSSTTVTVSGIPVPVTLKQPTFAMNLTAASTKISEMIADAHAALLQANGISTAYHDGIYTQLGQLFNPQNAVDFRPSAAWEAIKLKLTQILTGLTTKGHSIKVGTLDTGGVGSVNYYTGDRVGDIHLDKSLFVDPRLKGNATLTYLHEASHKYAGTHDYGYWDHKNSRYTPPTRGGEQEITNVQTLSNADSFAYVLYYLAGKNWRH